MCYLTGPVKLSKSARCSTESTWHVSPTRSSPFASRYSQLTSVAVRPHGIAPCGSERTALFIILGTMNFLRAYGSLVRATHLLAAIALSACAAAGPRNPDVDDRIARIENDIVAISAEGADSGSAQPLLSRMETLKVPGLSVAVFDSGRIVWARAYGFADAEGAVRVDTSTLFQAASISKPLASVALFRLVERGRLALDQDVNERLTRWRVPASSFTTVDKVTPRRIVTHMAGLTVTGFAGYKAGEQLPSLEQMLAGQPPANSRPVVVDTLPGARESYSGGGFLVLQLLLEEVSGKGFAQLLDDLVIGPARMGRSTFSQPLPDNLAPQAATGYDRSGKAVPGRYHTHPELAAAGLWSTPSDLARFMLSVGRAYRGEPDGLLTRESASAMLTRVPGGSGQGFGLSGEGNAFRYRHSGGNVGFTCYAVAFAGIGRGMVVMTNSDAGSQLIRELTRAVAREYGWPRMWVRE